MAIRCYSQRILNPFRGVMNIITIGGADAVTIDGKNWVLYIHDDFDPPTDDPEEFFEIDMPDIRFGEWSREGGLKRAPLIASYHYEAIQALGRVLLEAVEQHADNIPFAFDDHYELWLLDANNLEPLALLDSVCRQQDMYTPSSLRWDAGLRARDHFNSNIDLFRPGVDTHAELLNVIINQRAGHEPRAQWFYRDSRHDGIGLDGMNLPDALRGRQLNSRMFPKMLLNRQWERQEERSLVNAFLNWLSPYLLLLDFLRDPQRAELEQAARNNALLVERMYPLYPRIVDRKAINSARVEAMLRSRNANAPRKDPVIGVDYIELQA